MVALYALKSVRGYTLRAFSVAVGSPKMPDSSLEIGMGKSVTDTVKLSHNHILFGMNRDDSPASYGANAADSPVLPVASSDLAVIFEWVALLPLAIYLASSQLSHQLVSQTALVGFICVGLFPRLAVLSALSDFLRQGTDCTVTALLGLYGTATSIFLCLVFRICRQLVRVRRANGYLRNNEDDDPGCMLVVLHENASTWYLYRGSRGVIDGLLNKTMIQAINSPFGTSTWMGYFFSFFEVVQLVAMTYVAAQKGRDGVALLALVVVAWAFDSVVYTDDKMAALWLRREGVTMKARSFRFSGRTPLLGAIQLLSRSRIIS